MGDVLLVQANAKSAIDLACWDILGKSVDGPIAALLGGVLNADFPLYEAVLLKSPEEVVDFVREQGVAGIK